MEVLLIVLKDGCGFHVENGEGGRSRREDKQKMEVVRTVRRLRRNLAER